MKISNAKAFKNQSKKRKEPAFLQVLVELMTGFEPVTSSLPMSIYAHTVERLVSIRGYGARGNIPRALLFQSVAEQTTISENKNLISTMQFYESPAFAERYHLHVCDPIE